MAQQSINPFPNLPSPMPFVPAPNFPDMQTVERTLKEQMEAAITSMVSDPEHDFHKKVKELVIKLSDDEKFVDKLKHKFLTKEEYKKHKRELERRHQSVEVYDEEEEEDEERDEDYLCQLFHCVNYHHERIREGKSVFEIEEEITSKHKDITPEESKVLYALLKSDGPVTLSHAIGMEVEDFICHMKELGRKMHQGHEEEKETKHEHGIHHKRHHEKR